MARPTGLSQGRVATVRAVSGVIAADSATLSDANFPPAAAFDCRGLDTVFVGVEVGVPGTSTATVELLFRDEDAVDGQRWKRFLVGAREGVTLAAVANETTGALPGASQDMVEMRCYGRSKVFPRITAVANSGSTTGINILVVPGKTRNMQSLNRQ